MTISTSFRFSPPEWGNREMNGALPSSNQSSIPPAVQFVSLGKRRREVIEDEAPVYKKRKIDKREAVFPSPLDIVARSGDGELIGDCFSHLINSAKEDLLLGYLARCTPQSTAIFLSIEKPTLSLCNLLRVLQSKFPNLTRLSVEVGNSSRHIKEAIECCARLQILEIDCHFVDPEEFVGISLPPKLSDVCLIHAVITDAVFGKLASMTDLQRLFIHSSRFDFSNLPFRNQLSIRLLDLADPDISDKAFEKLIEGCQALQFLEMDLCPTSSPEVFTRLAYSSKMKVIRLRNVSINDQGIAQIQRRCPQLGWLCLNGCYSVSLLDIDQSVSSELHLVKLSATSMNEKSLNNLKRWCPNLRILKLQGCSSTLIVQLEQFTKLYSLNLLRSEVHVQNILRLLHSCPDLTKLIFSECRYIGFNEPTLPTRNRLESLELLYAEICERDLQNMLQLFPALKMLSLCGCTLLTDVLGRIRFSTTLRRLNLSEISLTDVDLGSLKKRYPDVEIRVNGSDGVAHLLEEMDNLQI